MLPLFGALSALQIAGLVTKATRAAAANTSLRTNNFSDASNITASSAAEARKQGQALARV